VLTAWIAELENARLSFTQPVEKETRRVTRDEWAREYRGVVAKRLEILTKRENAGAARESLRQLLARERIALRPNMQSRRFEGTVEFDASQLFLENQIDIKLVAGARFVEPLSVELR
jgi:hypothetical protein